MLAGYFCVATVQQVQLNIHTTDFYLSMAVTLCICLYVNCYV
jgi:hypothetical protein